MEIRRDCIGSSLLTTPTVDSNGRLEACPTLNDRLKTCPTFSCRSFVMSDLSRRELLGYSATFGSAFLAAQGLLAEGASGQEPGAKGVAPPAGKKYAMKKSINLWALPYP